MSDKLVKQELQKDVNLTKFETSGELNALAQHLISTHSLPSCWDSPEKVALGIQQAKELGFDPVTGLNQFLHFFEGRVTIGVHGITALMRKNNIRTRVIEDFVYISDKGEVHKDKIAGNTYPNVRTTVEATEYIFDGAGKLVDKFVSTISFSMLEAQEQNLLGKSNWKKMPKIMLRTRALALLGRSLGIMGGIYETSEVADFTNTTEKIDIAEDGEVTIIQ